MGEDKFIQTFAHELAHVYYGDHGRSPSEIDSTYWQPISELRADLKMEGGGLYDLKKIHIYMELIGSRTLKNLFQKPRLCFLQRLETILK